MRIVYVSTIERGGPLSHLQILAPSVAARGIDVHVVCANETVAEGFRAAGLDASVVQVRSKTDLRGAMQLRPLLKGASVVHTHDRRAGLFARPQARFLHARAVHTLHGLPEEIAVGLGSSEQRRLPEVSRLRSAWFRWGYPRVETLLASLGHVIVPSEAIARFLDQNGLSRSRIHVIPHGIEPPEHRRKADAPDGSVLRLATAANLEYWKGLDILLAACARLQMPVHLDVFGEGSLRTELVREAAGLGVEAVFHGFVPDVRQRLVSADVFVLPSRGDNAPMSILEAMACGLPVVSTRVGGIPELVTDGQTGLLVAPDDPAGLAAAIETLASDPELRARLGAHGATRVREEFSIESAVQATVDVYEGMCASSM